MDRNYFNAQMQEASSNSASSYPNIVDLILDVHKL